MPQIAYTWIKDHPNVGPIVLAARNEEQLQENMVLFDIQLTQEEHDRIESTARPAPTYPLWHHAMNSSDMGSPAEMTYLEGDKKSMGRED